MLETTEARVNRTPEAPANVQGSVIQNRADQHVFKQSKANTAIPSAFHGPNGDLQLSGKPLPSDVSRPTGPAQGAQTGDQTRLAFVSKPNNGQQRDTSSTAQPSGSDTVPPSPGRDGTTPLAPAGSLATDRLLNDWNRNVERQVPNAAEYMATYGGDPNRVVGDLVKKNNVTFIGQTHALDDAANPTHGTVGNVLKGLPPGAHLSLELTQALQPTFDKFNASPKGTKFVIPQSLPGEDGQHAVNTLNAIQDRDPALLNLIQTAHDAGQKIDAIDLTQSQREKFGDDRQALDAARDKNLADRLQTLAQKNPKSSIIAYLGQLHGAHGEDDKMPKSAAQLLKDNPKFQKMAGKTASVFTEIPNKEATPEALHQLTGNFDQPIAAPTQPPGGGKSPFASIPVMRDMMQNYFNADGHSMAAYDAVVVYPNH
jgi:hypothetical protein